MRGNETREKLKSAARKLFAVHGIDGVSVRDIVSAADQKNGGSLHYYFGTKEALIAELINDGARIINDNRTVLLAEMRASTPNPSIRDILKALLVPTIEVDQGDGEQTYLRFIGALQLNHRRFVMESLDPEYDESYRTCLQMLRDKLPEIPAALLNQRLVFAGLYLNSTMAAREVSFTEGHGASGLWEQPTVIDNLLDTFVGLITAPLDESTSTKTG